MLRGRFLTVTSGALAVLAVLLVPVALIAQSRKAEFRDATSEVDGFTLHYRICGSGPILLMLHGLLDELGAKQVYGIGHSAGGMALLHMAAQQPKRLKAMVLVNAPHYLGPDARKIAREDTWERLDPAVQEWYRRLHPGGQSQAQRIFRQYNGLAETSEHIAPEVLKILSVNTLIVWGDRDPAFPLEIPMGMYRSLPNAALWVIPQQGHTPLWVDMGGDTSAAAAFGKIAKDFLAQEKVSGGKWF